MPRREPDPPSTEDLQTAWVLLRKMWDHGSFLMSTRVDGVRIVTHVDSLNIEPREYDMLRRWTPERS